MITQHSNSTPLLLNSSIDHCIEQGKAAVELRRIIRWELISISVV